MVPVFRSYFVRLVNGGFIIVPMVPYASITYCGVCFDTFRVGARSHGRVRSAARG